jgi:hypothetical protein
VDAVVFGIYNDIFELSAIPEHPLQGIIGMANKPGMRVTNGGATGAYAMLAAYTGWQAGSTTRCSCWAWRRRLTASTSSR